MNKKKIYQLMLSALLMAALVVTGCSTTDSGEEDEDDNGNNTVTNFNSSTIAPGESYSYTFEDEGTVEYYCEIHAPNMQGEIEVDSGVEAVERDTVIMEGDQFDPRSLSVAPDTEVIWINNENHDHDIRSGNPPSNNNGGDY